MSEDARGNTVPEVNAGAGISRYSRWGRACASFTTRIRDLELEIFRCGGIGWWKYECGELFEMEWRGKICYVCVTMTAVSAKIVCYFSIPGVTCKFPIRDWNSIFSTYGGKRAFEWNKWASTISRAANTQGPAQGAYHILPIQAWMHTHEIEKITSMDKYSSRYSESTLTDFLGYYPTVRRSTNGLFELAFHAW